MGGDESAAATSPRSVVGSVIAPSSTCFLAIGATWYSWLVATKVPGAPFWIRFFATSTETVALEPLTLER